MKKILILGVVAVLLSFGLILASCGNSNCPDDGYCDVRIDSYNDAYFDRYCSNGDCSASKLYL